MTDDLVKRLRDVSGVIIGAQSQNLEEDYGLAREAADRIEQLEAALWKIVVREHQAEIVSKLAEELADIARIALEKKDD